MQSGRGLTMLGMLFDLDPISPKDGERYYVLKVLKTDLSLEEATREVYADITSEKLYMPIRIAWKKLSDDITVEDYIRDLLSHSYCLDKKIADIDKIEPQRITEKSGRIVFIRDGRKAAREIITAAKYNWD